MAHFSFEVSSAPILVLQLLSCFAINLKANMANMLTWFTIFPLKKSFLI